MKRTQEGELVTSLILGTFRLNGELLAAGNSLTKPFGLTSARWQVMGAIDLAKHPLTVAQIARRMGLARQGVQRIVNDLEGLEMVCFEANPEDRRAQLVAMTEKGAMVMNEVNTAQAAWVNQLSDGLNLRHLKQAVAVLENIRERTEKTNE